MGTTVSPRARAAKLDFKSAVNLAVKASKDTSALNEAPKTGANLA